MGTRVTERRAVEIVATPDDPKLILHAAGGLVVYGTGPECAFGSQEGTLAAGQSLWTDRSRWLQVVDGGEADLMELAG